jgi:hypothetical protein
MGCPFDDDWADFTTVSPVEMIKHIQEHYKKDKSTQIWAAERIQAELDGTYLSVLERIKDGTRQFKTEQLFEMEVLNELEAEGIISTKITKHKPPRMAIRVKSNAWEEYYAMYVIAS